MMLLQCLDSADVCDVKGLSFICYHLVSCQKRQKPFIAEKVDATILLFKRISWKHPYLNIIQVKINTLYKCIISMYCSDINLYICLSKQYFRLVLTESIQLPKNLFWLNVQSSGHDLYVHAYIVIMYCMRFLSVIYSLSFLHSSSIQVVGRIDH